MYSHQIYTVVLIEFDHLIYENGSEPANSVNLCSPPLKKKEMGIAFCTSSVFKIKYQNKSVHTRNLEPCTMHYAPLKVKNNVPSLFFKDKVQTLYILDFNQDSKIV